MTPSSRSPLPPKLYYRIGEVADLVGVAPHVLRYWESEFRSIRPTKSARGQRVYSRRDVEGLMRVRELLHEQGFTIAGARRKLQRAGAEATELAELAELAALADQGAQGLAPRTREQLVALRRDIEAFLDGLGGVDGGGGVGDGGGGTAR